MYEGITPIQRMGDYYVKREDLAHWSSLDYPSGSKVRQYKEMTNKAVDSLNSRATQEFLSKPPPCIVGCSANSAMAIYVAATAHQQGMEGIVYTAGRKKRTDATKYAAEMGAEIVEVKPGYLSLIRARARARTIELGDVVKWSPQAAIEDTIRQCENIPEGVKRIIVPTGSGLTAAGILARMAMRNYSFNHGSVATGHPPIVVIVSTSSMANELMILKRAHAATGDRRLINHVGHEFIPPTSSYNDHEIAELPDGTPLDPYYSAKAFKYLQPNDMLWPVGLRPVRSMPDDCKEAFKNWKGPK